MTDLVEDLKQLNARVEDIARAIQHEQELIAQLENRKQEVEKEGSADLRKLLNQIENNKRRLRDLEYTEQNVQSKKKDLEQAYQQDRIDKLQNSLLKLTEKRERIKNLMIPRLEEKLQGLKEKIVELDTEILRVNGKIQFLSGK